MKTKKVVFITGAFVTHHNWDRWIDYFGQQGFAATAPPWPFKDLPAAVLRDRQPYDTDLASLTLNDLVEYYVSIIASYEEKPIVIGHALGGLIAQIIVNRGIVGAGVAIRSLPPFGVVPYEYSFLRSGWRTFGLFTSLRKTYLMSFKEWQSAWVNEMPLADQQKAYLESVCPESKKVMRGTLTGIASIEWKNPHAPLLITAGGKDLRVPAHLSLRNFNRYPQDGSITQYKEFPDGNHYLFGDDTWKAEADYILEWLGKV